MSQINNNQHNGSWTLKGTDPIWSLELVSRMVMMRRGGDMISSGWTPLSTCRWYLHFLLLFVCLLRIINARQPHHVKSVIPWNRSTWSGVASQSFRPCLFFNKKAQILVLQAPPWWWPPNNLLSISYFPINPDKVQAGPSETFYKITAEPWQLCSIGLL